MHERSSPKAPLNAPLDLERAGWERHPDSGFIDYVGPLWMRHDAGRLIFGFMAEPKHENKKRVVQGGMLMTFADRAFGMASFEAAGRKPVVTVNFECQFLAPVEIGTFVELPCEVTRATKSLVFVRGILAVGERPVASASGVWKVMS